MEPNTHQPDHVHIHGSDPKYDKLLHDLEILKNDLMIANYKVAGLEKTNEVLREQLESLQSGVMDQLTRTMDEISKNIPNLAK